MPKLALREVTTTGAQLRLVDGHLELDNAADVALKAITLLRRHKPELVRQLEPIYRLAAPEAAIAATRAALFAREREK